MINKVNKEIKLFISSIDRIDKDSASEICEKFKTSISDNLKNGHITTNVCMIAGSILKCDPKSLATNLHKRISDLKIFENVEVAGPGFINITLKRPVANKFTRSTIFSRNARINLFFWHFKG